jgi:Na+/H+ antiporter NhaD/arsenite permease-like protein
MSKLFSFLKNEIVLILSFLLAVISAFWIPPSKNYLEYIDFRTLALLFCLMAVMAGFNQLGIFRRLAEKILARVRNVRELTLTFCLLCFFSSMIITNDVSLITFVPFSILTLKLADQINKMIFLVTMETISANLGSMVTPIGNPQNLYLFSNYHMDTGTFFSTILPYTMVSLVLIIVCCLMTGKEPVSVSGQYSAAISPDVRQTYRLFAAYGTLFLLALLSVFRLLPVSLLFGVTVITLLCMNRTIFRMIDYSLLLTFVFLFIFIGNLGNISQISQYLQNAVQNNEVIIGVLSSQIFSNVPAAILLSNFTKNASDLLIGVNLGGLGTLIASMASLISFKLVQKESVSSKRYLLLFTIFNIIFLAILLILWILLS